MGGDGAQKSQRREGATSRRLSNSSSIKMKIYKEITKAVLPSSEFVAKYKKNIHNVPK
jgi:hypothetical protein